MVGRFFGEGSGIRSASLGISLLQERVGWGMSLKAGGLLLPTLPPSPLPASSCPPLHAPLFPELCILAVVFFFVCAYFRSSPGGP